MAVIALDVGGTKIAGALFSNKGEPVEKMVDAVSGKKGEEVGQIILDQVRFLIKLSDACSEPVEGIGICVPGIYDSENGTVWAPNIRGWESYPLRDKIIEKTDNCPPVFIDSDRSCYILGEVWKGNARGCKNAIFLAVGTGIGAGILIEGKILHGAGNVAGAVGWLALNRPHRAGYNHCGCFEYHASGEGLARMAREKISNQPGYQGFLRTKQTKKITGKDVFSAYSKNDPVAEEVMNEAIECWGMGIADLISIFNPEKIILGGGVMKSSTQFLDQIKAEAARWAQPVSFKKVSIEITDLGSDAGIYGAAYLASSALNGNDDS
jgi:glucokinase